MEACAGWAHTYRRSGVRGMGRNGVGVKKASESSIEISFTYRGIWCRERLRIHPTPANLKRAERHRHAILDAIERGTFDYAVTFPESKNRYKFEEQKGAILTMAEWLERWHDKQKQHLKSSTWDDYRKIIYNTLIPTIGTIRLPELKRSDIRDLCDKLPDTTNKRLANIQSVVRSALSAAMDDDLIEQNPLYGWKYTRKEAPKSVDDVDPFDAKEQQLILDACRDPQHRNLFKFAFWSGLRTSELVALEWGDIDWLRGTVRISRAKTQAADEAETTKTKRSTRDVKLLPPALEALTSQKAYTFLTGGEVFHNPRTQKAWEGDQAIRQGAWHAALKKAGVRYRRAYQTRHTYASMMLTAGEPIGWVASQLGHSDLTMFGRVYGRWISDAQPDAGSKAVAMFAELTHFHSTASQTA